MLSRGNGLLSRKFQILGKAGLQNNDTLYNTKGNSVIGERLRKLGF